MSTYTSIPTNSVEYSAPYDAPSVAGAAAAARDIAADPRRWQHLVRYGSGSHRWYVTLPTELPYEIWLITWLPEQGTGLHDHGESLGAFAVAAGSLTESTLRRDADGAAANRHDLGQAVTKVDRFYRPGKVRAFGAEHLHLVRNDTYQPAVSVHAYAPALTTMTRYSVVEGQLRVLDADRAGQDW